MSGRGWFEVLYLFNVGTSLLWVGVFFGSRLPPLTFHLCAAPLYVLTAIDLFLLFNLGNRLSSAYIGIAMTDYGEAAEFLSSYLRPVLTGTLSLLLIYGAGLFGIRKLAARPSGRLGKICALLLLLIYGTQFANTYRQEESFRIATLDLLGKELGAPMGGVFQTALATALRIETGELVEKRKRFAFTGVSAKAVSPGSIFVWIVGESSRPHNWGLMGYARDTTPRLQALDGLVPLTDLLTNAPYTSYSVTSMFSLRSVREWEALIAERTLVSVFNQAGFMTHWLSTQEADGWGGMIQHVANEAQNRRYFDRALDVALVSALRRIVEHKPAAQPLFIVLHTKGSHWRYDRRFPKEFERFTTGTGERDKLVDQYDNSILYTDWVISEVIATVARRQVDAAVFYVSDHGQNLYDDAAQLFGHAIGNQYDLHVPGVIWLSPSLRKQRAPAYAHLLKNSRLPLSMADLSHSFLDIAGVRVDGLQADRSVFSADYLVRDRWYHFRGKANLEQK